MIPLRKPTAAGSGLRLPDFKRRFQAEQAKEEASTQPVAQTPAAAPSVAAVPAAALTERSPTRARSEQAVSQGDHTPAAVPSRLRAIAVSTRVMSLVRDTAAGVLLCQLIYWTRRGVDVQERDGWIYKTAHEWQQETGLSWKVQRRARTHLLELDVLEERKQLMPARLEFRLKLSTLVPMLAARAELAVDTVDLAHFRDSQSTTADELIGRAFLFHGTLVRVFPVHSAMMCSRLIASARLPALDGQALMQAAGRGGSGQTRLVTMHRDQWRTETGLSRDQWQTARRHLREAGVLVERRHNFPRRVDLAVDMRALAEVLRQSSSRAQPDLEDSDVHGSFEPGRTTGYSPYRQDRAKQAGGIGHHPIPPSQSPDPAVKDRPIPPLGIAQSHLYPLGLQGSVHPQPQNAGETAQQPGPSPRFTAFAWGGGGGYGTLKVQIQPPVEQLAVTSVMAKRAQALIWPKLFAAADQEQAIHHLAGLDRAIQQTVLDEIDWLQGSGKPIRSPVALARTLARKAKQGEFVPDGAHRIAADREAAAAEAVRRRQEAIQRQQAAASTPTPLSPEAEAARERLAKWRAGMRRRAG